MKSKESVLKCPSCSEILPALANVCPSCNYVIAARNEGETVTLQELVYRIENTLGELKAIPHPSVASALMKNVFGILFYLGLITLFSGIMLYVRKYPHDLVDMITALGMIVMGIPIAIIILKKAGIIAIEKISSDQKTRSSLLRSVLNEKDKSLEKNFKELKADFEKSKRLANTFYGEDRKVRYLIDELNDELKKEEDLIKKAAKPIKFIYISLGAILLVPILLPEKKMISAEPIAIMDSNIELLGGLGSKYSILSSTQITINEEPDGWGGHAIYIRIPIKLELKPEFRNALESEVRDILNDCEKHASKHRTLKACATLVATMTLTDHNGMPIGITINNGTSGWGGDQLVHEVLGAAESLSDNFIITFKTGIDEEELHIIRKAGGASVNLTLNKEG